MTAPPYYPDPDEDRAIAIIDNSDRPIDDRVRDILTACRAGGFVPTYISTSCIDAPGDLTVDGIPVVGQTWIARSHFYPVRRVT